MKKFKFLFVIIIFIISCKLKQPQHNTADKISKPIKMGAGEKDFRNIDDINNKISIDNGKLKIDNKFVLLENNNMFLKDNEEPGFSYAISNQKLLALNEENDFQMIKIFPLYCISEKRKEGNEDPPPPTFVIIMRDEQKGLKVGRITRNDFQTFINKNLNLVPLLATVFGIDPKDIKKWKMPKSKDKLLRPSRPPQAPDKASLIKSISSLISKVSIIKHNNIENWKVIPINNKPNMLIIMLKLESKTNVAYLIKAPKNPEKSPMLAS